MDAELIAISRQLLDEGEAIALAEVLTSASNGPTRPVSGVLQIAMSSLQHPAMADLLIAIVNRQGDFSTFSLLGRHRADPRVEAKLKDLPDEVAGLSIDEIPTQLKDLFKLDSETVKTQLDSAALTALVRLDDRLAAARYRQYRGVPHRDEQLLREDGPAVVGDHHHARRHQ